MSNSDGNKLFDEASKSASPNGKIDPNAPKKIGVYDRPEKKGMSTVQVILVLLALGIAAFILYQVVF